MQNDHDEPQSNVVPLVIGIVMLVLIACAAAIGIGVFYEGDSTPLISSLLGFTATALGALALALRQEYTIQQVNRIRKDVEDGVLKEQVKEAINEDRAEA